jgi:hypothetical protein
MRWVTSSVLGRRQELHDTAASRLVAAEPFGREKRVAARVDLIVRRPATGACMTPSSSRKVLTIKVSVNQSHPAAT